MSNTPKYYSVDLNLSVLVLADSEEEAYDIGMDFINGEHKSEWVTIMGPYEDRVMCDIDLTED